MSWINKIRKHIKQECFQQAIVEWHKKKRNDGYVQWEFFLYFISKFIGLIMEWDIRLIRGIWFMVSIFGGDLIWVELMMWCFGVDLGQWAENAHY